MSDPQAIEATKMWPEINRFSTSAGPERLMNRHILARWMLDLDVTSTLQTLVVATFGPLDERHEHDEVA